MRRTPEAHFVAVERRLSLENPGVLANVVVEEFDVLRMEGRSGAGHLVLLSPSLLRK